MVFHTVFHIVFSHGFTYGSHIKSSQLDGGVSMMSSMGYSQMVRLDPWLNMYAFDGSDFFEAGNLFVFLVSGILLFTRSPGSHTHMITSSLTHIWMM